MTLMLPGLPGNWLALCIFVNAALYPPLTFALPADSKDPASGIPREDESTLLIPDEPIENNRSISVTDKIDDAAIQKRIKNILATSAWFTEMQVSSSEGIVVLSGITSSQEHKSWAGNVATRTEGVVAVINKISLAPQGENGFAPVIKESHLLWESTLRTLPLLLISGLVFVAFLFLASYLRALSHKFLRQKVPSVMLRRLLANLAAAPVMLVGIYLILRITGLSKIATTIMGGTGLVGLVLGFAFRDIAENFLASILISIQRPFRLGDTIQVLQYLGVVQAVTTRGTIIMTLEGNHVQIPNTTIYKEAIVNLSANPNMRMDFMVGIGYDASIEEAQTIALEVLTDHDAVLASPEPWVLAEALSAATVNLRIYFWVNTKLHNPLKVKSAIIRNIKYAFLQKNISMPDDAREVIFPQGIPIVSAGAQSILPSESVQEPRIEKSPDVRSGDGKTSTVAEADLATDIPIIKSQARRYSLDEEEANLLDNTNSKD